MPLFLNVQRAKPADQVSACAIATKETGEKSNQRDAEQPPR